MRGGDIKLPAKEIFHWEQIDLLDSEEPFHTSAQSICLLPSNALIMALSSQNWLQITLKSQMVALWYVVLH